MKALGKAVLWCVVIAVGLYLLAQIGLGLLFATSDWQF